MLVTTDLPPTPPREKIFEQKALNIQKNWRHFCQL